ncbi:hypothetical protein, partial [Tabrizicola sp.]|uniref:hypothetical protein n=1 Tax=Tabrizicola sp. TaxID=2005166 RepID=UPI003F3364CF
RMNVVEGTVEGRRLTFAGLSVPVAAEVPEGPCTVGFRPEDIEITSPDTCGAACAALDGVFPAGPEVILNLTSGGQALIARQMRGFHADGRSDVWIRVAPEVLNIFDKTTGRLIDAAPGIKTAEAAALKTA